MERYWFPSHDKRSKGGSEEKEQKKVRKSRDERARDEKAKEAVQRKRKGGKRGTGRGEKNSSLSLPLLYHLWPPHLAEHVKHLRLEDRVDGLDRDARAGLCVVVVVVLKERKGSVSRV